LGVLGNEGFGFFASREGLGPFGQCEGGRAFGGSSTGRRRGGSGGSSRGEGAFGNGGRGRRSRTFTKCATQCTASYTASGSAAKGSFEVFTARATFSREDREASLLTFECGLCNFNGNFDTCTDSSTSCDTATKALTCGLGGFGSGAAEDAGCAEGGNVGGAFKGGLNGSGTRSSTRTGNVPALLNLALDVGAEELREGSGGATQKTANNSPRHTANNGAYFRTRECTAQTSSSGGEGAGDGFGGCSGSTASPGNFSEGLTKFGGEGGFSLELLLDAAFTTKAF
jgi:hypothetical protein